MKALLLLAIALLTSWGFGGCANLPPRLATCEEAELTPDGFRPILHSGFARAWVRSGTSFAKYDRILADCSEISYRHPPRVGRAQIGGFGGDNFALPAEMKTDLEESCRAIFRNELSLGGAAPRADGNEAGVLLVRVGRSVASLNAAPLQPTRIAAFARLWARQPTRLTASFEAGQGNCDLCSMR